MSVCDIIIKINGQPTRGFASQGQQRSIVLSMKLAEGEVCKKICGEIPVFLFDDVFSELDANRRAYLSGKIHGRQVIITSCERGTLNADTVIEVQNGVYSKSNS